MRLVSTKKTGYFQGANLPEGIVSWFHGGWMGIKKWDFWGLSWGAQEILW